jgi:hypothetical protein
LSLVSIVPRNGLHQKKPPQGTKWSHRWFGVTGGFVLDETEL